jgi:hypothetical protein
MENSYNNITIQDNKIPPLLVSRIDLNSENSDIESNPKDSNWYSPRRLTTRQRAPADAKDSSTTPAHVEVANNKETSKRPTIQTHSLNKSEDHLQWEPQQYTYEQDQTSNDSQANGALQLNNQAPTEDPSIYSIFNPGHSRATAKEKRYIQQNETSNNFKGDVMQDKDHTTFGLYFGNANQLNLGPKGELFKEICEDQKLMQAHYRGIAETCLDTDRFKVKQTLHQVAKSTFDAYSMEFAGSPTKAVQDYKPGGVMLII